MILYNNHHHIPLFNVKIRQLFDQVISEENAEANNVTFDAFVPHRNKSDNIFNKIANFPISDVRNDTINKVGNLSINNVRNDSNGSTVSDVKVKFAIDSARISHQNLLSVRLIRLDKRKYLCWFLLWNRVLLKKINRI